MLTYSKKNLLLCFLLFTGSTTADVSKSVSQSDIILEFHNQLVTDLALNTLQNVARASSPIQNYKVLKSQCDDIELEISDAIGNNKDKQRYQVLSQQLDIICNTLGFYVDPGNNSQTAAYKQRRTKDIAQLRDYLLQQPVIKSLFKTEGENTLIGEVREVDFDGEWLLVDSVQGGPYDGLELGFRLNFKQNGMTFEAQGEKTHEQDIQLSEDQRTPLKVNGFKKNNVARATFSETGKKREFNGEFVWLALSKELLSGVFVSDTGASGTSLLVKIKTKSKAD